MKLYFAPLEGITSYIYRNAHSQMFGGCDFYYAPFISPSDNEKIGRKGFGDILPENNEAPVKIQVLTNNASSFVKFCEKASSHGYDEINLNLGCPSGTVVGKNRGAGFLRDTDALDSFLGSIFASSNMAISIKTRIGFSSPDEFDELLKIYNKYPLSLLVVHPRTRTQMYKGTPHLPSFSKAYEESTNPLCYNGDILSSEDYGRICAQFPNLHSVMIGRGAVQNPAIFREIRGGEKLSTEEVIAFTNLLCERYNSILDSDTFTLNKLKEVWLYMMLNYPEEKKIQKALRKAFKLSEFLNIISHLPQIK